MRGQTGVVLALAVASTVASIGALAQTPRATGAPATSAEGGAASGKSGDAGATIGDAGETRGSAAPGMDAAATSAAGGEALDAGAPDVEDAGPEDAGEAPDAPVAVVPLAAADAGELSPVGFAVAVHVGYALPFGRAK